MNSTDDVWLPFQITHKHFPIRVSFVIPINKVQCQTLPNVNEYFSNPIFSHDQLYFVLSRGIAQSTTNILVKK